MGYSKSFIILNRLDEGFCENGATGYCKIESGSDKGKATVFIQGLKPLERGQSYNAYLICHDNGKFAAGKLGEIGADRNSGEINIEFNSQNVLGTGKHLNEFSTVVVSAENKYSPQLEFPLAGFSNNDKTEDWRGHLSQFIMGAKKEVRQDIKEQPQQKLDVVAPREENQIQNQSTSDDSFDLNEYLSNLKQGNYAKVNELMYKVRGAQEFNPFDKARLKYKWWKITNVGFFENIFRISPVSNQIFKHPVIKRMLRQANHCLFGFVTDFDHRIRYIAFGFPARYSMKEQLYVGGFSVFYPTYGYMKKNGDLGYWVVHIRLDNDSLVMNV